jgi:phenylacetate-CoA ligase
MSDGQAAPFDEWHGRWDPSTPTTPDALRRWQLERAWAVVERVAGSNPFYRRRLRLPGDRSAESFRQLPMTTKDEVIADCAKFPPFGNRATCPPQDVRHVVETSGSTNRGKEIYVLDDHDAAAIARAQALGFWWAGARPGMPVLLTLPVGVTAAGQWYLLGLQRIGANAINAGAYPTRRRIELLAYYGAEMVIGTPTFVQRLAIACEEAGLSPESLGVRSLVVAGEAYSPAWAASIQARWGGAVLHEQYGCTERVLAWTCPGGILRDGEMGVLHFPPELTYWEVVDRATGAPVGDGEWGELVTTPLDAWASPLVRFATGDRVQFVEAGGCPCGRLLPGIRGGSVQRYDDMLKIRGVNVWPAQLDRAVFSVPGVVEVRGEISVDASGREKVLVLVECRSGAAHVEREVAAAVRAAVGISVAVSVVEPGALTASAPEDFSKVSRWRDLRHHTREAVPRPGIPSHR